MSVFDPTFEQLPATIPVFPLSEVLLLPRGRLPLNIFEPRYLAMVEDALAAQRMIGMIQPVSGGDGRNDPDLYATGCAGRICRFEETEDGRYLIALAGVCRFNVAEELEPVSGYRRVRANWSEFRDDLEPSPEPGLNRKRLLTALKDYFGAHGLEADWAALREAPEERLVTCLSMICPFGASEKQALLEAADLTARAEVLLALIEMDGATCGPMRQ
ncbi:MAG: LON peptidase substrate-binding domain-containing protein [Rhodospirillales bacterium]|nr:MAG: LON peptidase substrate-binding domain-containing protein [Rhodospirillales bacterium]